MVSSGRFGRFFDLFVGGFLIAIFDVVFYGACKEPSILQNHTYLATNRVSCIFGCWRSIDHNLPHLWVVEPHNEVYEGGFASPRWTDYGNCLTRSDMYIHVFDQWLVLFV